MKEVNVLVTRPHPYAGELVTLIKKTGVSCDSFPLMAIERIENPVIEQQLQTLNDYDAVICISHSAAQFGLEHLRDLSITPASHLQWFALGNRTADVLRSYGVPVMTPEQAGTSETLLSLPWFTEVSHQCVMIWKGIGGRELLAQTLRDKGAFVDNVELYRRVMPNYAHNELDQVLIERAIDIIMITSGEVLENLWQLAIDKSRLKNRVLIVPSERVVMQARTLGFEQVLCASAADDESMLACLQQYQLQSEANV